MIEKEIRSESTKICSGCGQPIDMTGDSVIISQNNHFYHEDHFKLERPRWTLKDKDTGMAFYEKGTKRLDILEGEDEYRGVRYKDIIIYDSDFKKDVLVRNKKEPLDGKTK
jgi:hypothetical protein